MSDEETKAGTPASAAPKKPRAKKAAAANGAAKPAPKKTASAAPRRKAPAKPAVAPVAAPATALAVTAGAATTQTSAFSAAADKVSAMMPDNMTDKAKEVAGEVKDMASDAALSLARIINDSAGAIDDNVGPKYGDYARSAAQTVSDAADRLRAKDVDEIAADTREFVRAKPGAALGIAAVASLILAKIFGSVFGKRR